MLSAMQRSSISAAARLRAKSQVTIPRSIVDALGVAEGDRFLVEVADDDPDTIWLHRIRGSYAGALSDAYSDPTRYLEEERGTWDGA
jgi:bifunctional DNA-binding transcriptional regulator/antitoxin component of YhaV-PrlF toxin-antitoxin module